jgi:hypothetical protein
MKLLRSQTKNMCKKYIVILMLFLSITMVVSGCKKNSTENQIRPIVDKQKASNNIIATSTQENNSSTSTEENLPIWPEQKYTEKDYNNWKEFFNDKFKYKIKYPKEWVICDSTEYYSAKQREILGVPEDAGLVKNCQVANNPNLPKNSILFFPDKNTSNENMIITVDDRSRQEREKTTKELLSIKGVNNTQTDIIFSGKKAIRNTRENLERDDIIIYDNNKTYIIYIMKLEIKATEKILASFEFTN